MPRPHPTPSLHPIPRPRPRPLCWGLTVTLALGLSLTACTSAPPAAGPSPKPPACPKGPVHVGVDLSATGQVPVVHVPVGGCVVVTVPRSPFRRSPSTPPTVSPAGRLELLSDRLLDGGTRVATYTALRPGTATLSSTVRVQTSASIPEWSAVVLVH